MNESLSAAPAQQLTLPHRPLIFGIGGCSGSGKTTLARELTTQLDAALLPLDFYYRDLSHMPPEERTRQNFDHPDSLEHMLLVENIRELAGHRPTQRPVYDFANHTRVPGYTETVQPRPFIIVEGILALHYPELRSLYDFTIYVNAPHDVCLTRRIYRDIHERGRTEESVRQQYEATARPMADEYVLPSAHFASVTVEGTDALDWSIEQVLQRLHKLGVVLPPRGGSHLLA